MVRGHRTHHLKKVDKIMNTKLVMTSSAILMAITGTVLVFFSNDLSNYFSLGSNELSLLILQILGGLYFAFAMLNWTAKANLIGGIYSRPVSMANFTHFLIGGLALSKAMFTTQNKVLVGIAALLYAVFALVFGKIIFWPSQRPNAN